MSGPFGGEDIPDPVEQLTPSEVALARVLAAWEGWPGEDGSRPSSLMCEVSGALIQADLVGTHGLTDDGQALLARARKAGVV